MRIPHFIVNANFEKRTFLARKILPLASKVFLDFINSSQRLKRFVPLRVKDRHANASRAWYRSRVGRIGCAHVTWPMWNTRETACPRRRLNARPLFTPTRTRYYTSALGRVEGRSARPINELLAPRAQSTFNIYGAIELRNASWNLL